MDALTEVLQHCRMDATVFSRAQLSAPWAVHTRGAEVGLFHAVLEGGGFLILEGEAPLRLEAGDVVFLPGGSAHVLCDDPRTPPVPIAGRVSAEEGERVGMLRVEGGGAATRLLCGSVHFEDGVAHPLMSALPPVIRVPRSGGGAWLDATLRLLDAELGSPLPGADAVVTRLADVLMVGALRGWIQAGARDGSGWMAGLKDARIARALSHIHNQPQEPWTASTLASRAGMSRSAFYDQFQRLIGEPPNRYLTRWRMFVASRQLRQGDVTVAEVAERVGYRSEFAFAKAFKRHVGAPPGLWRRAGDGAQGPPR